MARTACHIFIINSLPLFLFQCCRKMTVTSPESLHLPRSHALSQSVPTGLESAGWLEHTLHAGDLPSLFYLLGSWKGGQGQLWGLSLVVWQKHCTDERDNEQVSQSLNWKQCLVSRVGDLELGCDSVALEVTIFWRLLQVSV